MAQDHVDEERRRRVGRRHLSATVRLVCGRGPQQPAEARLEPCRVRSREDRGLSHVLPQLAMAAQRRDRQRRAAPAQVGRLQSSAAENRQVSLSTVRFDCGNFFIFLSLPRGLLYNGRNNMQAWGLIVLLISKAAGHLNVDEMEEDKAAGVLHSQRALAEVTEMIRTSHLVHNGLVNIYPGLYPEPVILNDMAFGNKIALLSGDYLLSNSCAELASLRNQDVSTCCVIISC